MIRWADVNVVLTLVHVVDQFNQILNENVEQVFDMETHNWGCTVSAAFESGWGLVPTPLPGTNDVSLSLGWEFSLEEGGEASLQRNWEEGTATFSMAPSEVQCESNTSSGSVFGSQQAEKRRSRKREEGGWERKYTHAPSAILSVAEETHYKGIYGINISDDG